MILQLTRVSDGPKLVIVIMYVSLGKRTRIERMCQNTTLSVERAAVSMVTTGKEEV